MGPQNGGRYTQVVVSSSSTVHTQYNNNFLHMLHRIIFHDNKKDHLKLRWHNDEDEDSLLVLVTSSSSHYLRHIVFATLSMLYSSRHLYGSRIIKLASYCNQKLLVLTIQKTRRLIESLTYCYHFYADPKWFYWAAVEQIFLAKKGRNVLKKV